MQLVVKEVAPPNNTHIKRSIIIIRITFNIKDQSDNLINFILKRLIRSRLTRCETRKL